MTTTLTTRLIASTRQAAKAHVRQAAALGLAALVTLSVLGSIDQLATTPSPDSLLATTKTTQVRS